MSTEQNKNFSSQRCAIPFGKFESGADDVYPCNESMIGREGARAKLIDFLTNAGTRKAILVTGRRGMGKTSFVQYCLHEYEEARVERYWRSEIGRTVGSLFWLVFLSMFYASGFVIGSRILQILIFNALKPDNSFLWIPTTFLVLILGYPLFHAGKIVSTILKRFPKVSNGIFGVFLIVAFIIYYIFCLHGSGSPIVTLSRLLTGLVSVYFVGEIIESVDLIKIGEVIESIGLIKISKVNLKKYGGPFLFCFGVIVICLTFLFKPVVQFKGVTANSEGIIIFVSNVFVSLWLFSLALLNRSIGLSGKPKHL